MFSFKKEIFTFRVFYCVFGKHERYECMRGMDFSGDDGEMAVDENDRGTRWIVHETNVAVLDGGDEIRTKTKKNKNKAN